MSEGKKKIDPKDRKKRSPETKQRLLQMAGFKCHYCGTGVPTVAKMVLDHKTPLSRYGEDTEENLAVACKRCDFIKGNLTEEEFRDRGLGIHRKKPYGGGRGMPKTMRFLRIKIRQMGNDSRTKEIMTLVLNGERVDISKFPRKVNPRRLSDRMPLRIRKFAREYPFLKMEGDVIWKCR